jgi:hypothetical protein
MAFCLTRFVVLLFNLSTSVIDLIFIRLISLQNHRVTPKMTSFSLTVSTNHSPKLTIRLSIRSQKVSFEYFTFLSRIPTGTTIFLLRAKSGGAMFICVDFRLSVNFALPHCNPKCGLTSDCMFGSAADI